MWRLGGLLALLAAFTNAQGVPRPTRLRIYEVRTALRFDEGELQRVNFRYDRSSGIKADIARSLVDVGLTTDRGFVFEVAFFGTEDPGRCSKILDRPLLFVFVVGGLMLTPKRVHATSSSPEAVRMLYALEVWLACVAVRAGRRGEGAHAHLDARVRGEDVGAALEERKVLTDRAP